MSRDGDGEALLRVEDLWVRFGAVAAVRGVSLAVARGERLALVGGNAAGKTTLLRAVAGLVRPNRGRLWYRGQPLDGRSASARVRAGIVYCPAERPVFPELTVEEELRLALWAARVPPPAGAAALRAAFGLFPELARRRAQRAGTLSGGEQRLLALARSLLLRPKLLLLDEPSLGLASAALERVAQSLLALSAQGITILMAEQRRDFAEAVATRTLRLERGRLLR